MKLHYWWSTFDIGFCYSGWTVIVNFIKWSHEGHNLCSWSTFSSRNFDWCLFFFLGLNMFRIPSVLIFHRIVLLNVWKLLPLKILVSIIRAYFTLILSTKSGRLRKHLVIIRQPDVYSRLSSLIRFKIQDLDFENIQKGKFPFRIPRWRFLFSVLLYLLHWVSIIAKGYRW